MTIEYREYMVPEPLQPLIARLWTLRAGAQAATEPIVSDGSVELIFHCGAPVEQQHPGALVPTCQPAAAVIGPTIQPTRIRPTGPMDCVGIRIRPVAVATFFGLPADDLRDGTFPIEDVVGGTASLLDCVASTAPDSRIPVLLRWLVRRPVRTVDPRLSAFADQLRRRPVDRVGSVCQSLGISERTLERLCRREAGLTAKELLRLARIQRVLALAAAEPETRWSSIAARCGYFDQSHFVHEFRELVGIAPSEFRARSGTLTDTVIQQDI